MAWDVFGSFSIGPIVKVDGKLNSIGYMQLVKEHVLPYLTDQMPPGAIHQ